MVTPLKTESPILPNINMQESSATGHMKQTIYIRTASEKTLPHKSNLNSSKALK